MSLPSSTRDARAWFSLHSFLPEGMFDAEGAYGGRFGGFLVEFCDGFLPSFFRRVVRAAESDAIGVSFDGKIGADA